MTFSENSEKGRPSIEYAVSLDMAKELAMVERNENVKRTIETISRSRRNCPSPIGG